EHQTVVDAVALVRAGLIALLPIFLEDIKGGSPSIGEVPAHCSILSSDDDGCFGGRWDEECCCEDCNDMGDHLVGPAFAPRKRKASRRLGSVLVAHPASTVILLPRICPTRGTRLTRAPWRSVNRSWGLEA